MLREYSVPRSRRQASVLSLAPNTIPRKGHLYHARRVLEGGDEVRQQLLDDAEPHVILADGREAVAGRVLEVHLAQELVELKHLWW